VQNTKNMVKEMIKENIVWKYG